MCQILSAALFLAACAVASSAQTSAEITGLVTDPSGAAISGASVTVTNKATGANAQCHDQQRRALFLPFAAARHLRIES